LAIQSAEDLFMMMLSNVRSREERSLQIMQEMSSHAQDPDVKKVLDTRAFLTKESISNLDECFRLLGKQPMPQTHTRMEEVLVEDFRRELNEIQSPGLRTLYVLHKIRELVHLQTAAYGGLIAMAEFTGNISVSALLETNLASRKVFIDRTRELLRAIGEAAISGKMRKAA